MFGFFEELKIRELLCLGQVTIAFEAFQVRTSNASKSAQCIRQHQGLSNPKITVLTLKKRYDVIPKNNRYRYL